MKSEKVIDIHCHLPMINPQVDSFKMAKLSRLLKLTFKFYCRVLKIKAFDDPRKIFQQVAEKLFSFIQESPINHFVVLALDGVYDSKGEMIIEKCPFVTPNKVVYDFAKKSKKILAGASINPSRKDAFQELEKAIQKKAALIKFLPGIQLFDPALTKYKKFYRLAAKYRLPILTHVGQDHTLPGMESKKELKNEYFALNKLTSLLEEGCTVIAAHGGGYSLLNEKKSFGQILKMLEKYQNLYLDNSALTTIHRKKRAYSILKSQLALKRLAFGTDFPIFPQALAFSSKLGRRKATLLRKIKNPLERDLAIKKLLGFPRETFSRGYEIINPQSL